jgi:ATP-binding cassette subfamily B protein/subfamily B ATP-binding cassette protein MsbA
MNATGQGRLLAIVRQCLAEMPGSVVLAAIGLIGVTCAELLGPWPLKIIFDHILLAKPLPAGLDFLQPLLDSGQWPALVAMAATIAAVALLSGGFSYLQIFLTAKVGHLVVYRLRGALFSHLQRLSLLFHHRARSGELLTKVASDTNLLRDVFADWALTFIAHFVTLVAMLAVMFVLNWRLTLLVLATLPPLLLVLYRLNLRIKTSVREQRRQEGRMASRLNEVLSSIAMIHAFGRQQYEQDRFEAEITDNLNSGIRTARTTAAVTKSIALVSAVGTAATVLFGAGQVLAGALTPGELLIFVAYVNSLYKPVRDLGRLSAKFSRAAVSAARISEVLDIVPDIDDAPDAREAGPMAGEIAFENVTFGYGGERLVLDDVSFRIRAGERVALVGPSGAGKSTLLSLLLRLYDPQAGRVCIDGIDVRSFRRDSLRREIGIVLQDTVLFGASVKENIAYGKPAATQEEIETAARWAHAHDFILDLPEGYDSVLSERGVSLSGGQRQRICLARALVKQPAILVMDEPTSAVDAVSARLINESVAQVQRGKTLVVIAHEYADMESFDRILVLKDGRIVESGKHEALLAARGTYLALVQRQQA